MVTHCDLPFTTYCLRNIMNQHLFLRFVASVFIVFFVAFGIKMVLAWVSPTLSPPDGNVLAPINTGSITQTKTGGLNIAITSGSVGIGTAVPQIILDVSGAVKIGQTAAACSATLAGAVRYNATGRVIEYCDGTAWQQNFSGGDNDGDGVPDVSDCAPTNPNIHTMQNVATDQDGYSTSAASSQCAGDSTTINGRTLSGVGFQPKAVILSSFQDITRASPVTHSRFGIGASDGTTEGSSAFSDTDSLGTTSVDGIDKTSKAFVKINNDLTTIDAEDSLTSMDSNGFTLSWTTNDAVATQMLYLALG